jgi:hypothetical protein
MILPALARFDAGQIKRHADFFRLVSRYTRLRRAARQYVGLCPFHSERHPSFYLEPARKLWNCFGCGLGGDVLSFVMLAESCDFVSALRFLAECGSPSNSPNLSSRVPYTLRPRLESFAESAARIATSLPSAGFIPFCHGCSLPMTFRPYRENRFGGAYQCPACKLFFGPRELRENLFAQRGAVCEWCRTSDSVVQMHHVLKKANPFDPAWIVLLCTGCRGNVRKLLAIQLLVFKGRSPSGADRREAPQPNSQSRLAKFAPFTCQEPDNSSDA